MSLAGQLPPQVEAIGVLTGLLSSDGTTFQPDWFEDPVAEGATPTLANAHKRLGALVSLLESSLSPATDEPPPVFTAAQWYAIPDPTTNTASPFCAVVPAKAPDTGELGLGILYTTTSANVVIEAYGYLPLVGYDKDGATIIASGLANPTQIGVRAATADGKGFAVDIGQPDAVTFQAMRLTGFVYLDPDAYTQQPLPPFFELTFEGLTGTTQPATYNTLAGLLNANVDAWIAEVVIQGSTWLKTFIGDAPATVQDVLVEAGFLTADKTGSVHLSIAELQQLSAQEIVLQLVFGALRSLSDADAPYAAIGLPGGGLYFVDRFNPDGSIDYGLRLAMDLPLVESTTAGDACVDLTLGSWLTGEDDSTGWIDRSLGGGATDIPDPGISVYFLREGPTPGEVSFVPSFAASSVGVNVEGAANAPLFSIAGVTLGGFEVRAYLDEHAGWTFGAAVRLDDLGIPLGPNFDAATASTQTNPVAQNLLASGSSSGQGDQQPVNPTLSMSAAWVDGGSLAFQLYDQSGAPAPIVVLPVQRSLGPLSLERLGVGWVQETGQLSLLVDGGVTVAVLTVDLTGLSVGIPITTPGDFSKYDLDLAGLGIAFAAGPVELSAAFVKLGPDATAKPPRTYTEYDGEAILSAGTFTIVALGSYAHIGAGGDGYTSLFIFGVLDADLGGPAFFYVTGIAAGFGYNRALTLPAQDAVTTFPLVAAASDPSTLGAQKNPNGGWTMPDPATALTHMDEFVPPERGEYWLSAGVRFTSFDLINSTALLVVEFGNELEIALLGLSWISLPPPAAPGASAPVERYAYGELGIEIKLLPAEGEFTATAVLTPNSFVIDPACKLTGGFAFYVWFGSNPHAGQFVLTLGGYHPSFTPPPYYPTVPRLGFDWPIGNGIEISGDAYFALTPSAVMAGGGLKVLFSSGDLHAWMTAQMDALIEWAPLHYELTIDISIGVSYRLNLLFVSLTINIELDADLTIWGPPTGGTVHVNWYVISFTVGFGAGQGDGPSPLDWVNADGTGFAQTLLPHATPQQTQARPLAATALATAASADAPQPSGVYTVSVTAGLITSFQDGAATVWVVSPSDFTFSVITTIPTTEVDLAAPPPTPATKLPAPSPDPDGTPYFVCIRPMSATLSSSVLTVTVTDDEHGNSVVPIATDFAYQPALASVAAAKWGRPLPAGSDPEPNTLLPGRLMGVSGVAPRQPTPGPSGADALALDVETVFGYETVDDTAPYTPDHLALAVGAQPSGTVPVVDPDALGTIAHTLMDATVVPTRADVMAALRQYGVDPGTDGPLTALAGQPGAYLTGNPLIGQGVPV